MKSATRERIRCAEEDFEVALSLSRRRTRTPFNTIGFHCQQCVEKYLNARLEEASLPTPRTHDLVSLLQLVLTKEPLWAAFAPDFRRLNDYAVKFRYPGHVCMRADAKAALKACASFRADARHALGLQ